MTEAILFIACLVLSIKLSFWLINRSPGMIEEIDPMYDHGYQHGRDGEPIRGEFSSDGDYLAGHHIGTLDRTGAYKPGPEVSDVNQAAQDFVDGYQHGEAGHDFQIALLESEAYRAGFRDGESMIGATL